MNLFPIQSESVYPGHRQGGRVAAVRPAQEPHKPDAVHGQREQTGRQPTTVEPQRRESAVIRYAGLGGHRPAPDGAGSQARRAMLAYALVSLARERETLTEMLGISIYA